MRYYFRISHAAFNALRRSMLRSSLTVLGITIGIAAVIALVEIIQGGTVAVQRNVERMGANLVLVVPGTAVTSGASVGSGSVSTLTPDDAEAIQRECPAVTDVAPCVRCRTQVVYRNRNCAPRTLIGSTPSYLDVRNWLHMAQGDRFTEQDVRRAGTVCVIGQTVCDDLFAGEAPLGKQVRIQNVPFTVVGVLTRKGANAAGEDQDDIVLAPWTTIKLQVSASSLNQVNQSAGRPAGGSTYPGSALGPYPTSARAGLPQFLGRMDNIDLIVARSRSGDLIGEAGDEINRLLRERHRIPPGQPEDFSVRDFSEIRQAVKKLLGVLAGLLLSVALIALFIGGVGIMNIMLVSVTERTREIGLRLAVGATPSDILFQFLLEAVLLCLVGGAAGIAVGKVGSLVVSQLFDWSTQSSFAAVVAAVAVSVAVGLIFGFFPAWKAARLKPIEALRYE